MTKAWPAFLAAAIPLAFANRRAAPIERYCFLGCRGVIGGSGFLPWHLWQYALHGLHSCTSMWASPHRPVLKPSRDTGGHWDYLDLLRRGFSIWGYLWPLAYLGCMKASARRDRRSGCCWYGSPSPAVILPGANQARLYISMLYPAIALVLGWRWLSCSQSAWRWPWWLPSVSLLPSSAVPADGSPDVKQFALQAVQSLNPGEPIYVSNRFVPPTHSRSLQERHPF